MIQDYTRCTRVCPSILEADHSLGLNGALPRYFKMKRVNWKPGRRIILQPDNVCVVVLNN